MVDFNSPEFIEAAKKQANSTGNPSSADTAKIEADKQAAETARIEAEKNTSDAQKDEAEKQLAESNRIAAEKAEKEKVEAEKNKVAITDEQFEKYLEEKTKGKYKKFEEVENVLNTPKEELDEEIKHWNDLKKKGIKIDKEFLELQAIDFDKIEAVDDIIFEKWKRSEEGKGLSEKAIRTLINKKYNVDEWREKDDSELTEDDRLNQELMLRDKDDSKNWLKQYKADRTLAKEVDPKIAEGEKAMALAYQQDWEKDAESSIKEITKLSSSLNKDESFDFEISEQDRKEVLGIVNLLTKDATVPFSQFIETDKDGNKKVNKGGIALMLLKAKNYDKAVALSASDATAKERLRIEKEHKGIDFTPSEKGTQTTKVYKSLAEAQAASIKEAKI